MGFLDDEQVKFARVCWFAIGRQHFAEQAQRAFALEEVNGGDEAGKLCPGIDMQPALAAQSFMRSLSTRRNSRPNLSRIWSRHCTCNAAGQTIRILRAR